MDVMREIEFDLNIIDDAFLILQKEYYLDEKTGDIEFTRVKQIVRGDPTFIRLVADKPWCPWWTVSNLPRASHQDLHSHQRTHQLRNMQSAIAGCSLCQHRRKR